MISPVVVEPLDEWIRAIVREIVREELKALQPARSVEVLKWLTVPQAAARLGCSADAVRMRVKRGRLEGRHQGRRLYVSAESVDRLG